MTENQHRARVVATAKKYLGCNEKDGSHRQIIDRYNSHKPLARGYAMKYTDAWCATFVSAVSIEMGLTDIMPTECGCPQMIKLYQKLGRWQENENYTPKPGDVIFYDWQDGADYAASDNKGSPDHVGIVVSVSGGVVTVIEGNKNDAVAYRTVKVNGRYIRGYGLPDYSSKSAPEDKPASGSATVTKKKCPYAEPSKNLRYGAKGNGVKWVQWHLNYSDSGKKLSVDGAFGVLTKAAVLRFQKKHGLAVDGIVGPKTRAALRKAVM